MFGLTSTLIKFVFLLDAVVILNSERFLNKVGLNQTNTNNLKPLNRKIAETIKNIRINSEFILLFLNPVCFLCEFIAG
ncbi:hypothetical protein A0H76_1614 [Hepatospora eriocheir]|uniref:Uncharacterized protein n=1 Tax=Hepatospora eriocheir TaxID=1081669 RepID=A0A1X0QH16_9MICR|nr:hypothetical protein A0H76_1614 [Hepatospora eriocheir]